MKQILLIAAALAAGTARAEEISGVVLVVGSSVNAKTIIADGDNKGPSLCANDIDKKVRRLGAMTVKTSGEWKTNKKGEKSCFEATDFEVLKTSSGRDAVVGTLSKKAGGYIVTGADGKARALEDVPGGLKKLDGQKVILDIKPINSPAAKEEVYKVVTYAAHP